MAKIAALGTVTGCLLLLGWACFQPGWSEEPRKEPPRTTAEKTVTLTEKQLEDLVQQRVAQAMLEDRAGLDAKIVRPESWHTAVYNGVEYTIYTGPGQVMPTRLAQPPARPPATPPARDPAAPSTPSR